MRDLLVTLIVFGSLPFILKRPSIGVLVWSWLSYMNPHRLAWGFAYSMPFAQIVAVALLISLLFTKEKLKIPISGAIIVWGLFVFWMVVTTIFSIYPETAGDYLLRVVKIQLVVLVTLMVMRSQQRLNQLVWLITLSIGFFSVKGGLFTILTGGSYRVYGPASSFIEENNSLALATLMIVPLIIYLYNINRDRPWIRFGLGTAVLFSLASIVGSQSRGALIGISTVAVFFWWKSSSKLIIGSFVLVIAVAIVSFMPQAWHDRMNSIGNYEEDASAMGRINAWEYSINVANARLTGAGFESWSAETFAVWAPDPTAVHAAHSIYFSVLADHGWLGFFLFVTLLGLIWRTLSRVKSRCRYWPEYQQQYMLAHAIQISLVAYMSGGAFLSLSYFDLPWHLFAIALLLREQTVDALEIDSTMKTHKNSMVPAEWNVGEKSITGSNFG